MDSADFRLIEGKRIDIDFKKDLSKLMKAYKRNGYSITSEQAQDIWDDYSVSMFASWLMMGDDLDSLFELTKVFAEDLEYI